MPGINPAKIKIVVKPTKFEYDQASLGLSPKRMIHRYGREGAPVRRILRSHAWQVRARERLQRVFAPEQFVPWHDLSQRHMRSASLVISAGGDNSFQRVSHLLDTMPMMGLNTDSPRSEGALTQFPVRSVAFLEALVRKLEKGDFVIEKWPRLTTTVNQRSLRSLATSEVYLGEDRRIEMSRHILRHGHRREEQKGSGLLVTTGAGSTGWYDSARSSRERSFSRTSPYARYLLTERYRGKRTGYRYRTGWLEPGETVRVRSLNDDHGIVAHDALEIVEFPRGAKAVVALADRPLYHLRVLGL